MPITTTWRTRSLRPLRLAFVALSLGVAGCATTEQVSPTYDSAGLVYDANELRAAATRVAVAPQRPNSDELICRKETPVGSHFSRTRCYTKEQAERIRKNAQLWLRTGGLQGGPVVAR